MKCKKHFVTSLKEGTKGQKYFTDILNELKIEWDTCHDLHYDIITLEPAITFECKYDIYCSKSGNLAIEFWNSKKNSPSGINATTATYWVHILSENEILIAKTLDLKQKCASVKPHRVILGGGDGNADMWLFKKEQLYPSTFSLLNKGNFHELVI